MVTPMMLALAPARAMHALAITEHVLRHVVLIRRTADGERPVVRAVTEVIEEVVRRATAAPDVPTP
jgi:hypothetical protein